MLDALAKAGFVTLEGIGDGDVSAPSFPGSGARALVLGGPESTITARNTTARADPGARRGERADRGR